MTLVTSTRESDGKFALRLESAEALQRDAERVKARRQREAELIAENAEWCRQMGFDPQMAAEIFA